MCGIVGLFIKTPSLESELGRLLADMLEEMTGRGPDSAGFAVYGDAQQGGIKATLRAASSQLATQFAASFSATDAAHDDGHAASTRSLADAQVRDTHVVATLPEASLPALRERLRSGEDDVELVGLGRRMEIYKEVGLPADVSTRFGMRGMSGSHGIGHTRMATESAVTTDGSHPFSTGMDQCLVHNGSLSNHNRLRQRLLRQGLRVETENDTEVGAAYLTWRMSQGLSLGQALESCLSDLDGFYTFVVGTENGFGVLRDPIACKPAVMAETDDYVAFASEYRALRGLPGVAHARLFEPEPATVYFWERH